MEYIRHEEKERLTQMVERRVGVGPTEIVSGWQASLKDLLICMRPFMRRGSTYDNNLSARPDAGVVVASHRKVFDVIVDALFAFPPFTPAVDIYDRGQLTAGYQYTTIDECRAELSSVIGRHLVMRSLKI